MKNCGENYISNILLNKTQPEKLLIEPLVWLFINFYQKLSKDIINNIEVIYISSSLELQNQILLSFLKYPASIKFSLMKIMLENNIKNYIQNFKWEKDDNSVKFLAREEKSLGNLSSQKLNILYSALLLGEWLCFSQETITLLIYMATNNDDIISVEQSKLAKSIVSRLDMSPYIGNLKETFKQLLCLNFEPLLNSTTLHNLFECILNPNADYFSYYIFIREKIRTLDEAVYLVDNNIFFYENGYKYSYPLPVETQFIEKLSIFFSQQKTITPTMSLMEIFKETTIDKRTIDTLVMYRKWLYSQPIAEKEISTKLAKKIQEDTDREVEIIKQKLSELSYEHLSNLKEKYKNHKLYYDLIEAEFNFRESNKLVMK